MKIKSYFSRTVEDAIALARQELGPDAMLVNSRRTMPEARHLGEYEVVFASGAGAAELPNQHTYLTSSDRLAGEVAELKRQLESMRHALTKSAFAPAQWLGSAPGLSDAYALLTANDVNPELAREIAQASTARWNTTGAGKLPMAGSHFVEDWRRALAEEMQSRFRVEPTLGKDESGPRVAAVVGPPGSGKTTTLVKLAVHYGLTGRRPVLLISLDTYRVAAADQLRSYAAILGVGFLVLQTVSALAQALEENRGKELILIDTPGWGFADMDASAELARFFCNRPQIERHLVLSASTKPVDLTRVIDAYNIFKPERLLFTRLDETASLGPIFNEAVRTETPLSFLGTGQRIPEDLETATAERLIGFILGDFEQQSRSAA